MTTQIRAHDSIVLNTEPHPSFVVSILGKGPNPQTPYDFSFREVASSEDLDKQKNRKAYLVLTEALRVLNIRGLLMPSVRMCNAQCAPYQASLYTAMRSEDDYRLPILWRCINPVDAIEVPSGMSGMMRNGDCPITVISYPEEQLLHMVHCARDSLLDRSVVMNIGESREHFSAIDSAIVALKTKLKQRGKTWNRHKVFCHIACSIAPRYFVHSDTAAVPKKYRGNNRLLRNWLCEQYGDDCFEGEPRHGYLDLKQITRYQLYQHGVLEENITHDDLDTFSHAELHSHVGKDTGRNAVIVSHNKTF